MRSFDEFPDELVEKILLLSTERDIDGKTARLVYSICRRWNALISHVLYRHLAWPGPNTEPRNFSRLRDTLRLYRPYAQIEHLLIHDDILSTETINQLAKCTHLTLRSLTIWPGADNESRLRFFEDMTIHFPLLQRATFVGNIKVRQGLTRTRSKLAVGARFPSLTNLHLIGSIYFPPFAQAQDVPLLDTIWYSHLQFADANVVLDKLYDSMTWVRDQRCSWMDYTPHIKNWTLYHSPPPQGTEERILEEFAVRAAALCAIMKESWADGRKFTILEDSTRRAHNRSPQEDSWEAVLNRIEAEDEF
ncbi:hypothetical protein DL96DRAFT_1627355 [Flagelloscypha sp. PMI_526]|nr:hypothetical protein DL96DRAFT_1627355 [Flagelloscypha sp. PMI_526]